MRLRSKKIVEKGYLSGDRKFLPVSRIIPKVNTRCSLSAHSLPTTTILSHLLVWICSLAAARAARSLATFWAGVSASGGTGPPPGVLLPPPPAAASARIVGPDFDAEVGVVLRLELRFDDGNGRDESDGGGFCGV